MKDDIKTVRKLCRLENLTKEQEFEFRDYLHELRESDHFGTKKRGDYLSPSAEDEKSGLPYWELLVPDHHVCSFGPGLKKSCKVSNVPPS